MGASLFGSMVRGFGFTLGRMAAVSTVAALSKNSDTQLPQSPYKTGAIQKLFIVAGWLWSIVYCIRTANSFENGSYEYGHWGMLGFFALSIGWLPIWLFFRSYNYIIIGSKLRKERDKQLELIENEKNNLRPKITELLNEIKTYSFVNFDLTSGGGSYDWEVSKNTATLEQMKNIYKPLYNVTEGLRKLKNKGYDNDTICNIYNEELWLGMNEEHMRDMKGEPDATEKETLRNGKLKTTHIYGNKRSGDVLVFEDGVLVSFKDR